MSGWTVARDHILQAQVGQTGVRVLVVEGDDDKEFIESLLDKVAAGVWASQWAVGVANGKQNVLKILHDQPNWLGIVDRDEWSQNAAMAAQNMLPGRLHILPRFCMESYFIDPGEIWAALPPAQQQQFTGGFAALETDLLQPLAEWVRHGALWHVINPLWDGLRACGFKEALLDRQAAQSDQAIQQKLTEWHQFLDPNTIFTEFQSKLAAATAAPRPQQLRDWVHGKQFFHEHAIQVLNRHLAQRSVEKWMLLLRQKMPVPPDLDFLWRAMQLI